MSQEPGGAAARACPSFGVAIFSLFYSSFRESNKISIYLILNDNLITADLECGASGIAEVFNIKEHLNVTMSLDATRGALHEETIYGERLTPRGRAEKLPILSWVDPDFVAPIRSDEFLPLGLYLNFSTLFN